MDFDNDGKVDLVSGSYDPGDIYLFAGQGAGRFEAGAPLKDCKALNLVHHPVEFERFEKNKDNKELTFDDTIKDRVASFGSWPVLIDWEGDGDLDIIIGSFSGQAFLRLNVGTRNSPEFSEQSQILTTGKEPLQVHGHFSPAVADWNRDGLWDLLAGADDGSVGWFPNEGSKSEPKFGKYQPLVAPKSDNKFLEQVLKPNEVPQPGVRAQVFVVDYDLDGCDDLLVGDFSQIKRTRELNEIELAAQAEAEKEIIELGKQLKALGYDADKAKEREQLTKRFFELELELNRFFESVKTSSFIWVYLRKPDKHSPQIGEHQVQPTPPDRSDVDVEFAFEEPVSVEFSGAKLPVRASYRLGKSVDSDAQRWRLEFRFEIEDGWHLYAIAPPGSPGAPLKILLKLPEHLAVDGDWKKSQSEADLKNPGAEIYRGQAIWVVDVVPGDGQSDSPPEVTVELSLQTCNDRFCLAAAKKSFAFRLPE